MHQKADQVHVEDPFWMMQELPYHPQKANGSSCSLPTADMLVDLAVTV